MSGTTQQRETTGTRGGTGADRAGVRTGESAAGRADQQTGKQATYLVIDGNEVVYRSPHFGEAWGFRNGWGADGAMIAKVVLAEGETLPRAG